MNYLTRSTDKDIGLYVPYASVKQILVSRFDAAWNAGTLTFRLPCLTGHPWPVFSRIGNPCGMSRRSAGPISGLLRAGLQTPGEPRNSDCVGDRYLKTCPIAGGTKHVAKTAPVNRRAKLPHPEAKPVSKVHDHV